MEQRMIHGTAVVEEDVDLGNDVEVAPFAFIERGARIGSGCVVGAHAVIYRHVSIGANCRIHAGAILGDTPQDTGFEDGDSVVTIGSDCVIREGVTIHRGSKPDTATEIGDGCFLMAFSHFAHNVKLGKSVIVANGALIAGYVEVGDRAFISGNSVVHQFVKVGRLAMVGGGAAISKDVPPFCTLRAASLNGVAGLNVIGMRRAGMSQEERAQAKEAFKILYMNGLNTTQAGERLAELCPDGPGREILDFMRNSTRGICPASSATPHT